MQHRFAGALLAASFVILAGCGKQSGVGGSAGDATAATQAATALVQHAGTHAAVKIIRAHTLPEKNASTRVLEKCGFRFVGEAIEPEDGLVWRWEYKP